MDSNEKEIKQLSDDELRELMRADMAKKCAKTKKSAVDFAKRRGYDTAGFAKEWHGYSVYHLVKYEYLGCAHGYPRYFLAKAGLMRMATDKETEAILFGDSFWSDDDEE